MGKFKLHISTLILLILLVVCYFHRTDIVTFVMSNVIQHKEVTAPNDNSYKNNFNFKFVQETNQFHVQNRQDILNVIYTVLNSGQTEFTFYCDINYDNCKKDLKSISEDQSLLSVINNMVSPYNSYEKLYITINTYGEAVITIDKLYNDMDIQNINIKIDEFKKEKIKDDMTNQDKIKAFHDYLVNLSTYDEERAKQIEQNSEETPKYNSHKANGPLLENISLCSGYSDAMKIYLDQLQIPNYKVANDKHIWNLVYIDDKWLHIDITWDDPITNDHSNVLLHNFFLINTEELLKLDQANHEFKYEYYPELK